MVSKLSTDHVKHYKNRIEVVLFLKVSFQMKSPLQKIKVTAKDKQHAVNSRKQCNKNSPMQFDTSC